MQSTSSSASKPQQSLVKKPFKFKFALTSDIKRQDQNHPNPNLKAMATLQRFKLLATQCGVTQSPTRSPRTSPIVHLRRRRSTIRSMLLGRRTSSPPHPPLPRRRDSLPLSAAAAAEDRRLPDEVEEEKVLVKRNSLKELFGASSQSPPWEMEGGGGRRSFVKEKNENRESSGLVGAGLAGLRGGPGSPRPVWSGFRNRSLLRRAWRPVLVTIPE